MRLAAAAVVLVVSSLAGACGKMASLEAPPGSVYPKTYPAAAAATVSAATPPPGTVQTTVSDQPPSAFTKSGAWIDPDTRRPKIDSRADQDSWSAINQPGTN